MINMAIRKITITGPGDKVPSEDALLDAVVSLEATRRVAIVSSSPATTEEARPVVHETTQAMLAIATNECPSETCGAYIESSSRTELLPGEASVQILCMGILCTQASTKCPLGLAQEL